MLRTATATATAVALLMGVCPSLFALDVTFSDPLYPHINSAGLDQPELSAVLYRGGQPVIDAASGEPIVFDAFVDTGASGFVISRLIASGLEGFPSLGLDPIDNPDQFVGQFWETGVAGQELGHISVPLEVRILDGEPFPGYDENGEPIPADLGQFASFGQHGLWVRDQVGFEESILGLIYDPLNIVGMPAIRQKVMVMDPTPLSGDIFELGERMKTWLVDRGDPMIPQTNLSLHVSLRDFSPGVPAEMSHSDNPVVEGVQLRHTDGTTRTTAPAEWLFDTGAAGTIVSFASAKEAGLIPAEFGTLEDFLAAHQAGGGLTADIGGIGGLKTVPLVTVDEIRVPSEQGFDLVWKDVDVMILDVAGLAGVFGMNLLVPAVTIDPLDPLGSLTDISPGYFSSIVFDATDPTDIALRLTVDPGFLPMAGDTDGDGAVDLADLATLASHWNQAGNWLAGDFTGDGMVDLADLAILASKWNTGVGAGSLSWQDALAQTSIPEPATAALLGAGLLGLLRRRRR